MTLCTEDEAPESKSTEPCSGCRDDFYNGKQNFNCFGCFSLKDAKLVTRYKLGWWTQPDAPGAFTKVETYDCHHAPGQYALYKELPSFAVDVKDATKP